MNPMLWSFSAASRVRVFFSMLPPMDMTPTIETLCAVKRRAHGLRGRAIATELLHNTLAPVHHPRLSLDEMIARAKQVGDGLAHPAFPVRFDRTDSFHIRNQGHPLVLLGGDGLEPLRSFRRTLCARMAQAGLPVSRDFTPHITMVWADRCVGEYPIAPIHWIVREFVLTVSLQGQSRHIHVARWPLK
jgi:2'-5' RNA ligase